MNEIQMFQVWTATANSQISKNKSEGYCRTVASA